MSTKKEMVKKDNARLSAKVDQLTNEEGALAFDEIRMPNIKRVKNSFINTITKEDLGKEVEIIVLKSEKYWIEFDEKLKVKRKSFDGKFWDDSEPLTEDDKWKQLCYRFTVLLTSQIPHKRIPMQMKFFNRDRKAGLDLNSTLVTLTQDINKPPYFFKANLYIESVVEKPYEWTETRFQGVSSLSDRSKIAFAHEVYTKIREAFDKGKVIENDAEAIDQQDQTEEINLD